MFAVLNCMPYVLAWPLNEQCDGCCLENMDQSGLCMDFIQQRRIGGEESTRFLRSRISSRHKAVLRNALIVSDHSRFFLSSGHICPWMEGWGCFPLLIKEWRGSSAKAAGWCSEGHSSMLPFQGCSCAGDEAVPCAVCGTFTRNGEEYPLCTKALRYEWSQHTRHLWDWLCLFERKLLGISLFSFILS